MGHDRHPEHRGRLVVTSQTDTRLRVYICPDCGYSPEFPRNNTCPWCASSYMERVEVVRAEDHAATLGKLNGVCEAAAPLTQIGHDHPDFEGRVQALAETIEALGWGALADLRPEENDG